MLTVVLKLEAKEIAISNEFAGSLVTNSQTMPSGVEWPTAQESNLVRAES